MNFPNSRLLRFLPVFFIFIWSSGFIVAKFGLPYAEPLTFLCLRYVGVVVFMGILSISMRAQWPALSAWPQIAIAGIMMQAGYLGAVWCAIKIGMPAGLAALIVSIQPILTTIFGPLIGERTHRKQWLGLGLGIIGVALVVANKISMTGLTGASISLCIFSLLSITMGTLYQKKTCPSFDVRTGQIIQFLASLIVTLPFALILETNHIFWTAQFIGAMVWSIFIMSGLGISILYVMIRHGEASKVTSYMYLVPAVTALMAWLMFDELITMSTILGMLIAVTGVALVVTPKR
jgi:drug/metabolite transporter (DMT)-like permease